MARPRPTSGEIQPLEKRAVDGVFALMDASLPYVDGEALNRSEHLRLALACFMFGAAHSYLPSEKLSAKRKFRSQAQMHAVTIAALHRLFQWDFEDCTYVAELVIQSTQSDELRDVMKVGLSACQEFESGDPNACRLLAEALNSIEPDDFEG